MPLANKAEEKFKEWLDEKGYPYLSINNFPEAYSSFFKDSNLKRPDFLILLHSLALIAVDVKERHFYNGHEDFILDEKEIEKYTAFERIFRIPVWFAFSNESVRYRTWYWISLSKVYNIEPKSSSITRNLFRPISITNCITIGWNEGLGKLLDLI